MVIHSYGIACVEHLDHTTIIAVKIYGSSVAKYKPSIEGGCEASMGEPLAIYKLLNRNSGKAIVTGRGSSPLSNENIRSARGNFSLNYRRFITFPELRVWLANDAALACVAFDGRRGLFVRFPFDP